MSTDNPTIQKYIILFWKLPPMEEIRCELMLNLIIQAWIKSC